MMFQGKLKELCQDIHNSLGNKKITEFFLVDVEFKNESFVIKSLKCLWNFINQDYSSKPWNRSGHFASFIAPKENRSLSLKDHRFNRLSECALNLLYHLDDIGDYLEKFKHCQRHFHFRQNFCRYGSPQTNICCSSITWHPYLKAISLSHDGHRYQLLHLVSSLSMPL